MSVPDLLETHTLRQTRIINIFSQPGTRSFVFLAVSFNEKCSILIRPGLSILIFLWFVLFGNPTREILVRPLPVRFSAVLSSEGFVFLVCPFRAVIPCKVTFVYGLRQKSRFIFLFKV